MNDILFLTYLEEASDPASWVWVRSEFIFRELKPDMFGEFSIWLSNLLEGTALDLDWCDDSTAVSMLWAWLGSRCSEPFSSVLRYGVASTVLVSLFHTEYSIVSKAGIYYPIWMFVKNCFNCLVLLLVWSSTSSTDCPKVVMFFWPT